MMKRITVLVLMALLLLVSPLIGCSNSGGGVANLMALVPAKANMVIQADISRILQDRDLTGMYDIFPKDVSYPQTFDDAVNELKDKYDIDIRDFQEGVLFEDVSTTGDSDDYSGAIVKGTFNKDDLIVALQSGSDMEWNTTSYKNYDIYSNENDDTVFAFVADNVLVLGTMQPVKDVIDVKIGDAQAIGGEVLDTYNKLGNALIKVAMDVPTGVTEGDLGQSAAEFLGNVSVFEKVKTVGMTVSKNDGTVDFDVKLCCADSKSAQSVEDSINGLIGLIGLFASMSEDQEQYQTLLDLLDRIEVTRSDACVNIAITATITEIEDLLQRSDQTA
jgi:hypothetical protein